MSLRSLEYRLTGEDYHVYVTGLAEAAGVDVSDPAVLRSETEGPEEEQRHLTEPARSGREDRSDRARINETMEADKDTERAELVAADKGYFKLEEI